MKINFDIAKLKKLMLDFNNCTSMTVSLFDSDLNYIVDAGKWQPYCLAIGNNPKLLEQCSNCNRTNLQFAQNDRKTIVYTCHAGIVESVTPITLNGSVVAYLMLGKFRDVEKKFSNEKKVLDFATQHKLNAEEMLSAYNQLPILTEEFISSAISILKACIRYILSENYIRFERSVLSAEIEQYIDENLGEKLTIDILCNTFHLSRSAIYAIFKTDFNDKVQNFITKKRIRKAQRLLTDTQQPIHAIASKVGFTDYSYFVQLFKKKTGILPLQYRKKFLKKIN